MWTWGDVYAAGEDPDPRFSLANERTFLAWIRTSLALIAAGVAVAALHWNGAAPFKTIAAGALVLSGIACATGALYSWRRSELAMRRKDSLPSPGRANTVVLVCILVAATSVLIGLLV